MKQVAGLSSTVAIFCVKKSGIIPTRFSAIARSGTSAMPTPRSEFRPKSGRPILYCNTPMAMLDQNLMGRLARRADRNIFQGNTAKLKAAWPFTRKKKGTAHGPGFAHVLRTAAKPASRKKKKDE